MNDENLDFSSKMQDGIVSLLKDHFNASDDQVEVDSFDDRFSVSVVSGKFVGLSVVDRHKSVYGALGGLPMGVHSLRISAKTHQEMKDKNE